MIAPLAALAAVLAVLVLLFAGIGRELVGPWGARLAPEEWHIVLLVRALHSRSLDWLMNLISYCNEGWPLYTFYGLFCTWSVVRRRWATLSIFLMVICAVPLLCDGTRALVHRPRPDWAWKTHVPGDLGYPSGHVMHAVILVGLCCYALRHRATSRRLLALAALIGLLHISVVGFSRIYLGHHYPSDNAAGFLMGLVWVVIAVPLAQLCVERGEAWRRSIAEQTTVGLPTPTATS